MTLYHVHWCPECQMVQDKLKELDVPYEDIVVPDSRPMRSQVYEVSGQYFVPVLKDGDLVLTETRDILSYLEAAYGPKAARSPIRAGGGPSPAAGDPLQFEEQRVPRATGTRAPLPDPQPER